MPDDTSTSRGSLPGWLYYGVLLLVASAFVLYDNPADRDLWHRLTLGQYMVEHHEFLRHDIFSYLSRPGPILDHEWGCGLLFYGLHCAGDWAIVAFKLAAYLATLLMVDRGARFYHKERNLASLSWLLLVALALVPVYLSTVRCLVFTNFFLALWLYWLVRFRAGYHQPLWPFALTGCLWANLHGGFLAGIGLIALYGLGEKVNHRPWRPFLHIAAAAVFGTLINPYTYNLWMSVLRGLVAARTYMAEWAPTPLDDFSYLGFKLLAIACLLTGLLIIATRRVRGNVDWVAIFALGSTLALAVKHVRHLAVFTIIAGVLGYRGLRLLLDKPNGEKKESDAPWRLAAIFLPLTIVFGGFLLRHGQLIHLRVNEPDYPVRAVAFLQKSLPTDAQPRKLLVPFNWGSYASWELYPRCLVSLDGRHDLVYTKETYQRVTAFFRNEDPQDTTVRSDPPDVILLPRNAALENRLTTEHGYRILYQDTLALIVVKPDLLPLFAREPSADTPQ